MATIYIEGRPYQVDAARNLLDVCLNLGFNLPFFCWHPGLGSVGACRQCAVKQFKDEQDARGRLAMACMTPAAEGTRISIADAEAVQFRKGVIEGLMESHPHDCPVCDEGGECHLQDMTEMAGHDYRNYRFNKRTFRNQYLGPFVNHEMNRCIQCYRCVRFYRDYAGGRDLDSYLLRNLVYFGRQQDGVLESEFSGNLVEVCPTGVFTDATLKQHYTRKWDLQFAPSICVHCGLGCNTSPAERYGTLRRIVNRYNGQVNGYFLCDRGRYGYEFVNSERRLRTPLWNGEPVARDAAVEHFGVLVKERDALIGIGSPRASLEANFALRELVGADRFHLGMADEELRLVELMLGILRAGPARTPSLKEIEQADAVLVLGEDVTNVAPRMALALRQSVRQQPLERADKARIPRWNDLAVRQLLQDARGPLFLATTHPTRLEDVATEALHAAPDDVARLGFAVARAIEGGAAENDLAGRIAAALEGAKRPLVVSGASCRGAAVIQAAANVAWALCRAGKPCGLSFTAPEPNTFGLALLGGRPLSAAFESGAGTVVVLENDLYRRAPAPVVNEFLSGARHMIALDALASATAARAELALPAGTFAESDGTLVSSEGRAQRHFQVYVPAAPVCESWRWIRDAMLAAGRQEARAWAGLDDVIATLAEAVPALARIREAAPPARLRLDGEKVAREPHRYSGRTAMLANISVHEPKPPDDPDSALAYSMEGYPAPAQPPAPLIPFFWAPGWNSHQQALTRFQEEINGPLRGGDPGVRLIEPDGAGRASFDGVPEAFQAREGEFLTVPLYHIFGSDELSMAAPAVASLAPKPYVALSPEDAAAMAAGDGDEVGVVFEGFARRVPAKIAAGLPRGVAGLPAGLPGLEGIALPVWTRIAKIP